MFEKKKLIILSVIRGVSILLMLAFNFCIVKYYSEERIGLYYLIATISYIGNGLVFVGADFFIQRQLSYLSTRFEVNKKDLSKFLVYSICIGSVVVMIAGTLIFNFWSVARTQWLEYTLTCCLLAIATYLMSLAKNIYQLADRQYVSSFLQIYDGCTKIALFSLAFFLLKDTSQSIIISVQCYSFLACISAVAIFAFILKGNSSDNWEQYGLKVFAERIIPIGFFGMTNWGQLQGYRPYLASIGLHRELGIISYVSNLASAAAAAVMSVLCQLAIPKIYRSKGEYIHTHVKIILSVCVLLSVLSLPGGYLFFSLAGKLSYTQYLYILPIGVIQESANAIIGSYTHTYNVKDQRLTVFIYAGCLGILVTTLILIVNQWLAGDVIAAVALSIVISQIIVCGYIIRHYSKYITASEAQHESCIR